MIVFSNITVRRGAHVLLSQASATIVPGQKVGLVGKNGAGKSTLLALIKGEVSLDQGDIRVPAHWRMATVNQETPALETRALDYVIDGDTIYRALEKQLSDANHANDGHQIAILHGELDTRGAWTIHARAATLLHGLGFSDADLSKPVKSFSGGWRMRLNLAQALLCPSELLLLDEPTNHLDLDAVIWLEKWLKTYPGTLILISHDRDFLDSIVTKIVSIERQTLAEYTGNYSDFEVQRATQLAQHQALYQQQQQKIAHLQNYIDRFRAKASKAKQAQSRLKWLERMEKIAPAHIDNPFHFVFPEPDALPSPLLSMENVVVGYDNNIILEQIKLNLVPGSRIGLLGRNGAGKSTLIKLLAGELAPLKGQIAFSKGVRLGYFAQHQLETLRAKENALWHLVHQAPQSTELQLRQFLGGFGFSSEKVFQAVGHFSGGEKARLMLALIVWNKPNLLLLDEPTNHLDLEMRQALAEALIDFEGALVVVSHDRHMLRTVTDEFYLVDCKRVVPFEGDLAEYQAWLQEPRHSHSKSSQAETESLKLMRGGDRKLQKRVQAQLRSRTQPLRNQIKQYEKRISELDALLLSIETTLADPELYSIENKNKLNYALKNQNQFVAERDDIETKWCEAQEQLDEIVNDVPHFMEE